MICKYCKSEMGNRNNKFGTFCSFCLAYYPPNEDPHRYIKVKREKDQEDIRKHLKQTLEGDFNANQTE